MNNNNPSFLSSVVSFFKWTIALVVIAVACYGGYRIYHAQLPSLQLTSTNPTNKLGFSPEEIKSIEDIGEWVFLTVEAEELVDTIRKHTFLSNDQLSRIYTGTLLYGINLHEQTGKQWIICHDDTLEAYLPSVKLMDRQFINEAQTRTFYQKGSWDKDDLKALYNKAQRTMMKRFHTQQNIDKARENAKKELTSFFQAYGYKTVILHFD